MDYMLFFDNQYEAIKELIEQQLEERSTFRLYIALYATLTMYNLRTGEVAEQSDGFFNSNIVTITQQSNIDELVPIVIQVRTNFYKNKINILQPFIQYLQH